MDASALVTEIERKLGREPVKNGHCGPGADWMFKDGRLIIFQWNDTGKMGDFYLQNIPYCVNTPWWSEHEKITSVIIENGITTIGKWAFSYCSGLTSVSIPNSVTNIGDWAFLECPNLKSICIPENARIGYGAFDSTTEVIYHHWAVW